MNAQEIGEALRQRRLKRKLSQTEAGALADPVLVQRLVSVIETDPGPRLLANVLAYAAALGCELHVRHLRAK